MQLHICLAAWNRLVNANSVYWNQADLTSYTQSRHKASSPRTDSISRNRDSRRIGFVFFKKENTTLISPAVPG